MKLKKYVTLDAALAALEKRGYDRHFQLKDQYLEDQDQQIQYTPSDLVMIEHHRFKNPERWRETKIIIALEDQQGNKGYITSNYGHPRHMELIKFIDRVKMKSPIEA